MKLVRYTTEDGSCKYGLLRLDKMRADGASLDQIHKQLGSLGRYFEFASGGSCEEAFVIKLKDASSPAIIGAYAAAAYNNGDAELAEDVSKLLYSAGRNSPFYKKTIARKKANQGAEIARLTRYTTADGSCKYGLLRLDKMRTDGIAIDQISEHLGSLYRYFELAGKGSPEEAFVIKLKDANSPAAIGAYAAAALDNGDIELAEDISKLLYRAGRHSVFCKKPD